MIKDSIASNWSTEQVSRWLQEIGMSEYAPAFLSNDISGDVLLHLHESDLLELGVYKLGHKRKIEMAIEALRNAKISSEQTEEEEASSSSMSQRFSSLRLGPQVLHTATVGGNVEICQLCFETTGAHDSLLCLTQCSHVFCHSCLKRYLDAKVSDNFYVINCVLCDQAIHRKDLEQVLSEQQMQKIDRLEIRAAMDADTEFRCCPTDGCGHVFVWEQPDQDAIYPSQTLFRCDRCRQHYCLQCKCPFHHGLTCIGYRRQMRARYGSSWTRFDNSKNDNFFRCVASDNLIKCQRCCRFIERPPPPAALSDKQFAESGGHKSLPLLCGSCGYSYCTMCNKGVHECQCQQQ